MLCVLLGWMVLIYLFSAQNSANSSTLSSGMLRKLLGLLPGWNALSAVAQARRVRALHGIFRKLGHFSEYAILGALASLTMRVGFPVTERTQQRVRYFLIPACFALLSAAGDEIHQLFVPGRSGEFRDVMIDFSGALLGILLTGAAVWLHARRKRKKQADT